MEEMTMVSGAPAAPRFKKNAQPWAQVLMDAAEAGKLESHWGRSLQGNCFGYFCDLMSLLVSECDGTLRAPGYYEVHVHLPDENGEIWTEGSEDLRVLGKIPLKVSDNFVEAWETLNGADAGVMTVRLKERYRDRAADDSPFGHLSKRELLEVPASGFKFYTLYQQGCDQEPAVMFYDGTASDHPVARRVWDIIGGLGKQWVNL